MRIEPFTVENAAYIVQLFKEMHTLSSFSHDGPPFDWDFTMRSTLSIVSNPNHYLRVARDDNDTCVGFVAGHMDIFFFAPVPFGIEDGWFVRPDTEDRTKIGVTLMRGFMSWVLDTKHGKFVQSGDIASIDPLAVDSIYKHLGFRRYGSIYKYERHV